jgi:hypothetical protein
MSGDNGCGCCFNPDLDVLTGNTSAEVQKTAIRLDGMQYFPIAVRKSFHFETIATSDKTKINMGNEWLIF